MAVEIRRILFSKDEFNIVANVYLNAMGPSLGFSSGKVMAVEVLTKDPLQVRVTFQTRDGKQIRQTLDDVNVVSAMTTFCGEMKIPLSKKSTKTAKINTQGQFAFDMVIQSVMPT